MMPVLECCLRTVPGRAGQDWILTRKRHPGGPSQPAGWLQCRAVQPLGVDMSRRYYTYVILPLLFSHTQPRSSMQPYSGFGDSAWDLR